MFDFDDLGEDDLDCPLILDQLVPVLGDEGDEELDVGTHQGLVLFLPVLRHQQGLVDLDVLLVGAVLQL